MHQFPFGLAGVFFIFFFIFLSYGTLGHFIVFPEKTDGCCACFYFINSCYFIFPLFIEKIMVQGCDCPAVFVLPILSISCLIQRILNNLAVWRGMYRVGQLFLFFEFTIGSGKHNRHMGLGRKETVCWGWQAEGACAKHQLRKA